MTAFKRLARRCPTPPQSLRQSGVALKGPLETRVGEGYRSINVYLRKLFDLYANVRPVRSQSGVHTPFSGVDLAVIRENTEDLYAGIEHQVAPGVVESVKMITARASTRIARFAFEYARTPPSPVGDRDSQGQHHEALRRAVSEVRAARGSATTPTSSTRSRSSTPPACAW